MSDISVLSDQYEQLVETSDKVNNSVITLKKKSILTEDPDSVRKYPKLKVTSEELDAAKNILLAFLQNVLQLMQKEYSKSEFIPSIILEDYKERLTNQYLREDVVKLIDDLKQKGMVSGDDMQTLDIILFILDTERSTLFRKLRKARG